MTATYPSWIDDGSEIPDPFGYGERAVQFLRNLKHPKSRLPGHAFQLDPWVERIVRRIYGPRNADGTRVVRTVFAMIPRGARKTTLGAALTLLHAIGPEKTAGGQIVCAAADQKQARIAFEEAVNIIRADKRLVPLVDVADYRNRFVDLKTGSVVEAISADAKTQHGRTPTFTLMDELHAWPKRDLWEALRTGLVKTPGSLNVIITTAGRGQSSIAFESYDYARKVALGEIDDPATLPVLFEADRDADWLDEDVWHRVNPGLRCNPPYPDIVGLRQLAREGQNRPGERESFRQLNLNVWLDGSADPFIDMHIYDKGADPLDLDALKGEPCWVAIDMSVSDDLTAIVQCWRQEDEDGGEPRFLVKPWFFCPEDGIRQKAEKDRVPYPQWRDEGFITATPGAVIDQRRVADFLADLCERFNVQELNFDPARASLIMADLQERGLPVLRFDQSWRMMVPAVDTLERAILGERFQHGGNPVLRWNFDNIAVVRDRNDNKTFHKSKSTNRIDGAVAAAMAVSRAAANDVVKSIYSSDSWSEELAYF